MTDPVRIARIHLTDLRGTTEREVEIPDAGILVEGSNGSGKSTLLDAVRLLFGGRECSPDDVRAGAERAVIEGSLSNGDRIVRTIPANGGSRVSGKLASGGKPSQEYLDKLVGGVAAFDPGRFLALSASEQARAVAEAMPVVLTAEHLARWGIEGAHDLRGHGLEALARVAESIATQRTEANAVAKALRSTADTLDAEAAGQPYGGTASDLADAEKAHRNATAALADLRAAQRAHDDAVERTEGTRRRVEALRSEAADVDAGIVPVEPAEVAVADERVQAANARVDELRAALNAAIEEHRVAKEHHAALDRRVRETAAVRARVEALRSQADDLEATLAGSLPEAPEPDAIGAAEAAVEAAALLVDRARHDDAARALRDRARAAAGKAHAAEERAKALQSQVDTLRDVAPRELAAEANAIEGLAITPKGISVGGVPFARCSTSQRAAFAVRLALLGSPRAGWVQVDNLEAFDDEHRAELIAAVLRAGRAFLGALVSRTELRVTPVDASGLAPTLPTPEAEDLFA